ncbi:MAG: WXG100 family type VII secretion target [Actinomycetia bacterium]|nr:WXG100 family type VII secretion target [Actinomycetes bacterium]
MAQVKFVYPAMLGTATAMEGHNGALRSVGSGIAAEQGALAAGWVGDTGGSFQSWQSQWNTVLEELTSSYSLMTKSHEQNTMNMLARDQAEGAKWMG